MSQKKKYYAVLTGDIIGSSKLSSKQRTELIQVLKHVFEIIEQRQKTKVATPSFEIYRGDSFQGIVTDPLMALEFLIMIRVFLRKSFQAKTEDMWDARIALGIGEIEHLSENLAECDGTAFRNSGPVLDHMKSDEKSMIKTPWKEINEEFYAECALLDTVIGRWSVSQSEAISELLLNALNQTKIAEKLNISQPAVNQRLKAAHWNAIEKLLSRYHTIITGKMNG